MPEKIELTRDTRKSGTGCEIGSEKQKDVLKTEEKDGEDKFKKQEFLERLRGVRKESR